MNQRKALPVFFVFLAMGFGDVVGPLVSLVKDSFEVSNFVASLLTTSGFIMFGLLSIPVGILQDKLGKKKVLSVGLLVALIGLVLPVLFGMYGKIPEAAQASLLKLAALFVAVFLLGAGATILQVSGNPIMRDVSPEGRYSANLSLGQSIKAVGSSMGFLLPPVFTVWFGMDWTLLFPVYAILVFLTWLWISSTTIEEKSTGHTGKANLTSVVKLLGNPFVLMMVAGIFLYVGSEVTMSAQTPILMKEVYGLSEFGLWVSWSLFFLPIFLGRLAGSFILRALSPMVFLITSVLLSLTGLVFLFFGNQWLAFTGIFIIGLGFSNVFPLIFSITIDRMPERTNELSGLMVMAIVGGAILPPLSGLLADQSFMLGFLVPGVSLLYLFAISMYLRIVR